MACCASLPYFTTADRQLYAVDCLGDTDDLLMYDDDTDEELLLQGSKCLHSLQWSDALDDRPAASPLSRADLHGGPLLNDCMWSAGMLPEDLKTPVVRRCAPVEAVLAGAGTPHDVDVDAAVMCAAVDPSLVSPCPPHLQAAAMITSSRHVTTLTPPSTADPGTDLVTWHRCTL